jgi:hypothetical protein
MEQVRERAEREARERAEAAVRAEIERARADADARLAAEVAAVRRDAERRRTTELAAIQAELELAREAAHALAQSAAAGAVSAEVARAEISIPTVSARVTADAAARLASMAFSGAAGSLRVTSVAARTIWERLPARTVPVAATIVLVAAAATLIDMRGAAATGVASLGRTLTPLARSARATATTLADTANSRAHAVSAASREAPRSRPSSAPAPAMLEPLPEERTAGMLVVFSRVPLDLFVGTRRIGTSEDGQIVMPPGRHRVAMVNTRLNYRGEVVLDVGPGAVTAHTVALPDGLLEVETEPGADVWVEGERAGVAPLGAISVPIGTREIVVRHPDLGERRSIVEVRYGERTRVMMLPSAGATRSNAFPLPRLDQRGPAIR